MITMQTGVKAEQAVAALRDASRTAGNVLGGAANGVDLFNRYLTWASEQERLLTVTFQREEIDRLLATRRYWSIQSMDPAAYGPALYDYVSLELNARIADFNSELNHLESDQGLWNVKSDFATFGDHLHAVVLDTNVLMNYRGKFDGVNWPALVGTHPTQSIGLAIPSVVVSELDRLKHENGKMVVDGMPQERRWLASQALRWLEEVFPGVEQRTLLSSAAMTAAGPSPEVYVLLLGEQLEHSRLAKADSEIISRAISLQNVAKSVTIVTFDTNMLFVARRLGLKAVKMTDFHERVDEALSTSTLDEPQDA